MRFLIKLHTFILVSGGVDKRTEPLLPELKPLLIMEVFKDECAFTFDNQESPLGVDVCLTCFIGTSPAPEHNFTARHARVKGHTAFLNLRKVPKSKPALDAEEDQEHRPKKLAVARETDEDKFETIATFKTLAEDNEADFEDAISHIRTADSYSKVKETEAWELELQPCEHVAILESLIAGAPSQTLTNEQLSRCAQCELDKNLWLCLECGSLGCGRRQFDGSGGNGHALDHFEQTQHALAVKLGSITPDGHVDVYCYADNDDVNDPKIREHLEHWGIDIAKQSKTEKSMTELQLEQNLNWDFAGAEDAERVSGKGLTGLTNLGNTCYLNSVVQILFAIPEFSALFEPNDPTSDEEGGPTDLTTQLRKMKDGLESGRYEHVSPVMLKYLIGKSHPEFATMRQQDAFEFLTHLLTVLSKNVKGDPAAKLFGFESERRIACTRCDAVRYIVEKQENVSVAVPIEEIADNEFKPVALAELLDLYTAEEVIKSTCPKCSAPEAVSKVGFKSFPQVLVINARRFRIVNWVPQKVDVPVRVSSHLNLDKYLSAGPQLTENVVSNDESPQAETDFLADPEKLVTLSSMGFPEQQCINALRLVSERGQPNNIEAAMEAILSGEVTNEAPKSSLSKQSGATINPESLAMLESMGFSSEQAAIALQQNGSNVEAAVEWLFAGNYDDFVANQSKEDSTPANERAAQPLGDPAIPANYELSGAVLHKGASVHVGHYIAAVKRGEETFIFNDEKVSKGADVDRLQQFAYIYLFNRIRS